MAEFIVIYVTLLLNYVIFNYKVFVTYIIFNKLVKENI